MNKHSLKKCLFFLCCYSFLTTICQSKPQIFDSFKIIFGGTVHLKKDSLHVREEFILYEEDTVTFEMIFPEGENWNIIEEGETLNFQVKTKGFYEGIRFILLNENNTNIQLDSSGYFTWTPSFDLVDRLEEIKTIQVIFKAVTAEEEKAAQQVEFLVKHVNRQPQVGEIFARKYLLPMARKGDSFKNDLDKLLSLLTVKNVASLELDATWRNKKKISDEIIKTTFNDFNPFVEQ
ncbi:hypothetical protein BH23BAC1_BH23BAC1_31910 [soil metagenome]